MMTSLLSSLLDMSVTEEEQIELKVEVELEVEVENRGKLFAIESSSGEVIWSTLLEGEIKSTPAGIFKNLSILLIIIMLFSVLLLYCKYIVF